MRKKARTSGPVRLSSGRRWTTYGVCATVWLTGAAWLLTHYFFRRSGTFGPEANPWEVWQLRGHGLAAFAFLWLFGMLWGVHILNGWASHRQRWSGGILFAFAAILIGSGYLLYYLGDEVVRPTVSVVHWIVGLGSGATLLCHRFWRSRA
jgi:hypothetical protein